MQKLSIIALSLLLPISGFANNAMPIPKQFQGLWAEKGKTCQEVKASYDAGLVINRNSFSELDRSCSLSKVYKQSKNQLYAKWDCTEEGENTTTTFDMRLSKDNKRLQMTPEWQLQYCGVAPKIR